MSDTSDSQRGIHYAESLDYGKVCYPDPEKVKRFHREWEGVTGYLNEWGRWTVIKGTSGTKREENFKWYIRSVRDWKRAVRRLERRLGKKECKNDD